MCSTAIALKRLTKHSIRDIAEAVSGEVPATFTEEVLWRSSTATHVATFAEHVAFTDMLQQHKEDFSSLLQHMADCYKALFTDKLTCTSERERMSIRIYMHHIRILIQLPC